MHNVIVRGDECLMILNLCFLFGIILVPFSADVLGNFPLSPLTHLRQLGVPGAC
jgi:uncharacterized membrane protein